MKNGRQKHRKADSRWAMCFDEDALTAWKFSAFIIYH